MEKWLGKTMVIPDSLPVYYKNDLLCLTNYYIDTTKYHIISNIDGTCHQCIEAFELWQDLIDEHSNVDVQFIFIVKTNAPKRVLFILETLDFNYPIIFDEKMEYEILNQIDDISNTVLTDFNQKILLVGNPIQNQKLNDLYLKIIADSLSNKKNK